MGEGERGMSGGFLLGRGADIEGAGRGVDVERGAAGHGRAGAAGGAARGRSGEGSLVGPACKRERERGEEVGTAGRLGPRGPKWPVG
jgi:hypothetical protein